MYRQNYKHCNLQSKNLTHFSYSYLMLFLLKLLPEHKNTNHNTMNFISKVLFIFLCILTISPSVLARDKVKINDINYFINDNGTAWVTKSPKITGDIIIPDHIDYNNKSYPVTFIGYYAFQDNNIRSIKIPISVTSIGGYAFSNCTSLETVEIPNSVKTIEKYAFFNCTSLTSVILPKTLTYIGEYAFYKCHNLNDVALPRIKNLKTSITFPAHTKLSYLKTYNSIEEIKNDMISWEDFYNQNKKENLTYQTDKEIEAQIKREIEKWQQKDEFETTEEWKIRVNEITRQDKITELSLNFINKHNKEIAQINEEQKRLAEEYQRYLTNTLYEFYQDRIDAATESFLATDFELQPYDADHGTFLIKSKKYGDILLPVPREEGRSFKENWTLIKITPEFVPNGEDVALTKIIFRNDNKQYIYDSNTEANYAVADVKYNFKPIELSDISLDDLNINMPILNSELPSYTEISTAFKNKNSTIDTLTPQKVQPEINTIVASDRSDVDYAIPQNTTNMETNTFSVIIANEDYTSNAKVPYAINDGDILAKYLISAVGLPQSHVKIYKNASYGIMAEAIKHIENLSLAYGDNLNIILYYSGHGAPDEKTKNAMLLPVDGNSAIPETCYALDIMIKKLGNLKCNNVIILMDACFSGAIRGDGMLMEARGLRGVKLHTNEVDPVGKMVIICASQGDETAYPYEKEQHGLFTYYLLKKLQINRGIITLGELVDYIVVNVKQTSILNNGKLQNPAVSISPTISDSWRSIQFR